MSPSEINNQEVCLIIPPSVFLLDERVFFPLGILRVAAVLENEGYIVHMIDLAGIENYKEVVEDFIRVHPHIEAYGLTSTTPQMPTAYTVAKTIRAAKPDARIILGGPHPTMIHAAHKKEQAEGTQKRSSRAYQQLADVFDVLVYGDGETGVFEALGPNPPKTVDADDPKSSLFMKNIDLNSLPFAARHLVDVESYHYSIDGERAMSLIAQLGCPFACGFCGGRESPVFRRPRTVSVERIIEEIDFIHQNYGVTGLMFYDDELNVNPKNFVRLMQQIAELQERKNIEFRLRGFLKSELFNEEQAEAMYRAGFRWILVGFESGSPRILTNINKKATQEDNTRCIEIAQRHGLKVKALMSIGHPGESLDTIQQTKNWLLKAKPDDFDVTIITTYPGTHYYDHAVQDPDQPNIWTYTYPATGDRLHAYELNYAETADYYKGDPDGGYKSYVFTDSLSADELVHCRNALEKDVRTQLNIPFNAGASSVRYEHSMGQSGTFPGSILRRSGLQYDKPRHTGTGGLPSHITRSSQANKPVATK